MNGAGVLAVAANQDQNGSRFLLLRPVIMRGELACGHRVSLHGRTMSFVFPRVRIKPAFMDKAPTGALGVSAKTGWINEQPFTQWFDYFVDATKPTACQSKTRLILDGHTSHVMNFEVIRKA